MTSGSSFSTLNSHGPQHRISVYTRVRPLLEHLGEVARASSSSAPHETNAPAKYANMSGQARSCVRCVSDTEIVVRGSHHHHHYALPTTSASSSTSASSHFLSSSDAASNSSTTISSLRRLDSSSNSSTHMVAQRPRLSSKSPILSRGTTATLVTPRGGGATAARAASPPRGGPLLSPPDAQGGGQSSTAASGEMLFQCNSVFDAHCTQQDVYEESMLELLDSALQPELPTSAVTPSSSVHVGLLCYGPTGSGKTYSMVGAWDPTKDPTTTMGILPRTALQILSQIDAHAQRRHALQSSTASLRSTTISPVAPIGLSLYAVELYLDELRDLLLMAQHGTNSAASAAGRRASSGGSVPLSPSAGRRGNTPPRHSSPVLAPSQQQQRGSSSPLVLRHGVSFPSGRYFKEGPQAIPSPSTGLDYYPSSSGMPSAPPPPLHSSASATIPLKDYQSFEELCETVTGVEITSLASLQEVYASIARTRVTSSTASNDKSSRSHAFFVLRIAFEATAPSSSTTPAAVVKPSFVVLADLAGSERLKQSLAEGVGIIEAASINKSLSSLCSVVTALHQHSKHIPYRDSRLTRLLKPCLENGRVAALVHVPPADGQRDEAIQTLKFAERMGQTVLPTRPVSTSHSGGGGASGDLGSPHDLNADLDPKRQEALEYLNDRALTQMELLGADVRIANAAYGFLPRRMSTLPIPSLKSVFPRWHDAWQHVRHAKDTDAVEGSEIARRWTEHARHDVGMRVSALKAALDKESGHVVSLKASIRQLEAQHEEDCAALGGMGSTIDARKPRNVLRDQTAAVKIKLLVQHRLHLVNEREAYLKRQAQAMKEDLLDDGGSWQTLHRVVEDASEALQCETRNGLVVQGLYADQCDVLKQMAEYLTVKRDRCCVEGLCREAEALGYGRLVVGGQIALRADEERHKRHAGPMNNASRGPTTQRQHREPVSPVGVLPARHTAEAQGGGFNDVLLDADDDDVSSLDLMWAEDGGNAAVDDGTPPPEGGQELAGYQVGGTSGAYQSEAPSPAKKRLTAINLFSLPTRSIFSEGGDDPTTTTSGSKKPPRGPPSIANEPTLDNFPAPPVAQAAARMVPSASHSSGKVLPKQAQAQGQVSSIFVTLRQRQLVPWYAATRMVPSPHHWYPRPLVLRGWQPSAAALVTQRSSQGVQQQQRVRSIRERQLVGLPSLVGWYHTPHVRWYVALRRLSYDYSTDVSVADWPPIISATDNVVKAHLLTSVTTRQSTSKGCVVSHQLPLVAIRVAKDMVSDRPAATGHVGNSTKRRRLELVPIMTIGDHSDDTVQRKNDDAATTATPPPPSVVKWLSIPQPPLPSASSPVNSKRQDVIVILDERNVARHLLALHVKDATTSQSLLSAGHTSIAIAAASIKADQWVVVEFSSATELELVVFALCGVSSSNTQDATPGYDDDDVQVIPLPRLDPITPQDAPTTVTVSGAASLSSMTSIMTLTEYESFVSTTNVKSGAQPTAANSTLLSGGRTSSGSSAGGAAASLLGKHMAQLAKHLDQGDDVSAARLPQGHHKAAHTHDGYVQNLVHRITHHLHQESRGGAHLAVREPPHQMATLTVGEVRVLCNPEGINAFVLAWIVMCHAAFGGATRLEK